MKIWRLFEDGLVLLCSSGVDVKLGLCYAFSTLFVSLILLEYTTFICPCMEFEKIVWKICVKKVPYLLLLECVKLWSFILWGTGLNVWRGQEVALGSVSLCECENLWSFILWATVSFFVNLWMWRGQGQVWFDSYCFIVFIVLTANLCFNYFCEIGPMKKPRSNGPTEIGPVWS